MNNDHAEALKKKAEELKQWALGIGLIKNGDILIFSVKRAPPAQVRIDVKGRTQIFRRPVDLDYVLGDKDWEAILKVDFNPPQRAFLEYLRSSDNNPVSEADDRINYSITENLNTRIHNHGLGYSFKCLDRTARPRMYRMYKLKDPI